MRLARAHRNAGHVRTAVSSQGDRRCVPATVGMWRRERMRGREKDGEECGGGSRRNAEVERMDG